MQTMSASRVDTYMYINVWRNISDQPIGNHVKDEHEKDPETIGSNLRILKKC